MDTTQRIRDRIDRFVTDIDELCRTACVEAVNTALAQELAASRQSAVARVTRGHARRKGTKRTPEQFAATMESIVKFVAAHENCTMESISEHLGLVTSDLALPMRKLLAEKRVAKKGQKRGTRYSIRAASAAKKSAKPAKSVRSRRTAKMKAAVAKAVAKPKVAARGRKQARKVATKKAAAEAAPAPATDMESTKVHMHADEAFKVSNGAAHVEAPTETPVEATT